MHFNSVRKLAKLDEVHFMLTHHTVSITDKLMTSVENRNSLLISRQIFNYIRVSGINFSQWVDDN